MSDRNEPRKSARDSGADAEDRPKGKFAYFVGKDATGPIGGARDYARDAEEARSVDADDLPSADTDDRPQGKFAEFVGQGAVRPPSSPLATAVVSLVLILLVGAILYVLYLAYAFSLAWG